MKKPANEPQIDNVGTVGGWHALKGRRNSQTTATTPFQGVPPSDIMNLTVNNARGRVAKSATGSGDLDAAHPGTNRE